MKDTRITPVVLIGGKGSRLAPLSTALCPKPFIPFPDGSSLLQHTFARIVAEPFRAPICVGNVQHRFLVANHARMARTEPEAVLLEAESCNTGLAVAITAAWLLQQGRGQEVVAILPADHAIGDTGRWQEALAQAAQIAATEPSLVLLGVEPTEDSSAYGYIHSDAGGHVTGFSEKPAHAEKLCKAGWVWNSGQVVARVSTLVASCIQHAPGLWHVARHALKVARYENGEWMLGPSTLLPQDALPFDRAVLERSKNLRVVRCDAGWQDVGTPDAFCAYAGIEAPSIPLHTGRTDHPWGYSEPLTGTHGHSEKRLTLYPGCRISLQRHAERDEHWHIIEGAARVTLGKNTLDCVAGDTVLVPRGVWHRIENAGDALLRVHEVQNGMPDEMDIERLADDYGRV